MVKYADLEALNLNRIEKSIIVYELGTDNEYVYTNVSKKTALLSTVAIKRGYINHFIRNNGEKLDGFEILEGFSTYSVNDFTVLK